MSSKEQLYAKLRRIETEAAYARAALDRDDPETFLRHTINLLSFAQFLVPPHALGLRTDA